MGLYEVFYTSLLYRKSLIYGGGKSSDTLIKSITNIHMFPFLLHMHLITDK